MGTRLQSPASENYAASEIATSQAGVVGTVGVDVYEVEPKTRLLR